MWFIGKRGKAEKWQRKEWFANGPGTCLKTTEKSVFMESTPKHSKEDEERFARLFEKLDKDKDGKIDVNELREGLERLGLPNSTGTAQVGSFVCQ